MARNFSAWLSGFRDSIADYRYYIDFEKVHRNVDSIKVELNILNSLIGSKNIKEDFKTLIKKYPEVLNVFLYFWRLERMKYIVRMKMVGICTNSTLGNTLPIAMRIMIVMPILWSIQGYLIYWKITSSIILLTMLQV